jgi:hypothetical protein
MAIGDRSRTTIDRMAIRRAGVAQRRNVLDTGIEWVETQTPTAGCRWVLRSSPLETGRDVLAWSSCDGHLRTELVLLAGRSGIDVSFQPTTAGRALEDLAHDLAVDPVRVFIAVSRALTTTVPTLPWRPTDAVATRFGPAANFRAVIGAAAFPLLGHVYDAGSLPLGEVPVWARSVLRAGEVRAAATQAFGTRATRRVVRAFAAGIVPDAAHEMPRLVPLAWALALGPGEPDHLARVLEARLPAAEGAPEVRVPDADDFALMRRGLAQFPSDRAVRLAASCAVEADQRRAVRIMGLVAQASPHIVGPLPSRLDEIENLCLRTLPRLAHPEPVRPPGPVARPRRAATRRGAEARQAPIVDAGVERSGTDTPRAAPRTQRAPRPLAFVHEPTVATIDGAESGNIRLVLPRTPAELDTWGHLLGTCVGDFVHAVALGRSWIIGVEVDGVLGACIEVQPATRSVRQFLGRNNRAVRPAVREPVLRLLCASGIIRLG